MSASYLGDGWVEGLAGAEGPPGAGQDGGGVVVEVVVAADRKRRVPFRLAIGADGGASIGDGAAGEPDLVVSVAADVYRDLLRADVAAAVAYMRGDLKIEGDPGPVVDHLRWLDGDHGRTLADAIVARTAF